MNKDFPRLAMLVFLSLLTISLFAQNTFSYTGVNQTYTVTETGQLTMTVTGADGGTPGQRGGTGATVSADFPVTEGEELLVVVGGYSLSSEVVAGGGGGSAVIRVTDLGNELLLVGRRWRRKYRGGRRIAHRAGRDCGRCTRSGCRSDNVRCWRRWRVQRPGAKQRRW